MVAEAEVWVLVLAVVFLIAGITNSIAQRITDRKFRIFKYLTITGVIGILLVPFSLIVAVIMGRTSEFLNTLYTSPLSLLSSLGTGNSYSAGCVDGVGAIYCFHDVRNPGIKWKDCSETCNSIKGVVGVKTSNDCQLSDREIHCATTGTGGSILGTTRQCNDLEDLGPISCTCCNSNESGRWWDCLSNCMSDPQGSTGFPMHAKSCKGITRKFCVDKTN